jgi:hypothetical protein
MPSERRAVAYALSGPVAGNPRRRTGVRTGMRATRTAAVVAVLAAALAGCAAGTAPTTAAPTSGAGPPRVPAGVVATGVVRAGVEQGCLLLAAEGGRT